MKIKRRLRPDSSSIPLVHLLPNIVTILALCIGISSMRYALDRRWEEAISLILIAGFLDCLDGRLARYLGATSNFGAHLDSLADFANFGVAPAVLLYLHTFSHLGVKGMGWGASLLYVVCSACRLARFNVATERKSLASDPDEFFTGINAPMGATLALLPIVVGIELHKAQHFFNGYAVAIYFAAVALGMASRIPTFSIKPISISRKNLRLILALFGIVVTGLVVRPWATISVVAIAYLISIPVSAHFYLKRSKSGLA